MGTTIMEVDIQKFKKNIESIQKYVGNKTIMPVIKANAYGTYLNKKIEVVNSFDIVAVAVVDEAIELRNLGYKKEIFVLNQPAIEELEKIVKYNITIGLSEGKFLEKMIESKQKMKVHLEIETGMNRTGIKIEDLENFIKKVKTASNIQVEGVYTHLSSADYDENYTNRQLECFKKSVQVCKENFTTITYIHSSASNGLLNFDDGISNLVRPGIIMYGYESFENVKDKIAIEPICKLKSKVTFLKEVTSGESIGYSRKFIAKNIMKVATVPIGYADGLKRELSNKGVVIINGQKARIIGNVCMDSCMVDVTNISDINVGTDVYIWDNDIRTLEDIANECHTINYEILSTMSDRVGRIFKF